MLPAKCCLGSSLHFLSRLLCGISCDLSTGRSLPRPLFQLTMGLLSLGGYSTAPSVAPGRPAWLLSYWSAVIRPQVLCLIISPSAGPGLLKWAGCLQHVNTFLLHPAEARVLLPTGDGFTPH